MGLDQSQLAGFLEAVYALELEDDSWLNQVLTALTGLCGPEHRYTGFFYDASDIHDFKLWNAIRSQALPELEPAFRLFQRTVEPELVTRVFRGLHVTSARRLGMPCVGALLAERERHGWGDLFAINGLDPSGIGCLLAIGCRAYEFTPSPLELTLYRRLATNLATAFRCRRQLGFGKNGAAPETRLEPRKHAAEHERRRWKSRTSTRHSLNEASWTLLDSFEKDGSRYIVARENRARGQGLAVLTDRERQIVLYAARGFSNKEIAFALGITDTTVRVLMSRAAGRLGVRTRRELLALPALERLSASATDGSG